MRKRRKQIKEHTWAFFGRQMLWGSTKKKNKEDLLREEEKENGRKEVVVGS